MTVVKKGLPVAEGSSEGLGLVTIMDRSLAARWGVGYVHLAVFAIDVDRIREEMESEELDDAWPAGWEVFMAGVYLKQHVDPGEQAGMLEDLCVSIMEGGQALGAQLPFAIYDLIVREKYPQDLRRLFREWKAKPVKLSRSLDGLWADEATSSRLATQCLGIELDPACAPPTLEELRRLSSKLPTGQ